MKAVTVFPGKAGSVHLAELPKPQELFLQLTTGKGTIKVFCEVAA